MKNTFLKAGNLDGTERTGLLVANFGANAEVQDENNNIIYCHIRKNLDTVITGDNVLWQPDKDGTGVIVGCLPRKSLLARPEKKKKSKPIAANIDSIIVVTAPATFSEYLIDRYLIAAENLKIPVVILLNKKDLLTEENYKDVHNRLDVYKNIGYNVLYSCALSPGGLTELETFLQHRTCVLVGTSGVGKSSIIAKFLPEKTIQIGETSAAGLGKHTTTHTRLYHLDNGGNLIDSPGIREFALWHVGLNELIAGFIEFDKFFGHCKFRDCKHLKEPECALQLAAEKNEISLSRLESYRKMLAEIKN